MNPCNKKVRNDQNSSCSNREITVAGEILLRKSISSMPLMALRVAGVKHILE